MKKNKKAVIRFTKGEKLLMSCCLFLLITMLLVQVFCGSLEGNLNMSVEKLKYQIQEQEKKPITILDDVYSELDDKHSLRLTKLLKNLGQVFVTTADYSIKGDVIIDVSKESATRRK